ncbi:MAG TPA: EF-hand domain-containing protein [Kofleriaceae bacterium]|jgi:hypothetical protein
MSKNWKLVIVSSLALVGSVVGIAAAQGGTPSPDRKAEFAEKRAEMVKKFDLNGDGQLDANEKAAMKAARTEMRFEKLDVNKDGVLSQQEFAAGKQGRFGHHHRHHKGGEGRRGGEGRKGDKADE